MNQKHKENLLSEVYEVVEESRRLVSDVKSVVRERIDHLAGGRLVEMVRGPECTEKFLDDSQPHLREAALRVYKDYWGLDKIGKDRLERIAFEDADDNIRAVALIFLISHFYKGSLDSRIGGRIATTVRDHSRLVELRIAAYQTLYHVNGVSSQNMPRITSATMILT